MKSAKAKPKVKEKVPDGWVDPLRIDALERRWRRFEVFDSRQRVIKVLLIAIVVLQLIIIFR
jgi:hypothetical protein